MEKYIWTLWQKILDNPYSNFTNTIKELVNWISAQPDYDWEQWADWNWESAWDLH